MSANLIQSVQTIVVYDGRDFVVTDGVAQGDPLAFADELVLDDVYQLNGRAASRPLSLLQKGGMDGFVIADDSTFGMPGHDIYLDCCLTVMAPDSTTSEILVLVEVVAGGVEAVYMLPLAPLIADKSYRLVGVNRQTATIRFAEMACVSFSRGTRITMASGAQVPIEALRVGDKVLTRDDGPQPVRWIGSTTVRATGEFAPVMIRQGALHNANDLILSPDHRLFVYQRQDRLGAGRHEVLVKVRHLVNGDTVVRLDGGFIEYLQLLFDDHQIIFAEGIAAESLYISPHTRAALPAGAADRALGGLHDHRHHMDYEVRQSLLSSGDAVEMLRNASSS